MLQFIIVIGSRDATTGQVPTRFWVRSSKEWTAPPTACSRYESGRASPNKTRPDRSGAFIPAIRKFPGPQTRIAPEFFPAEPDEPENFVRTKSHKQKISRAAELRSRRVFSAGSCAGKKIFSGLIRPRAKNHPAPGLGYQGRFRRRASPGRPWISLGEFWYNGACCEPGCTSFP